MLLAFMLLTASVGFCANAHYCKNKLQSISLLGKAKTCSQANEVEKTEDCSNYQNHKKLSKQQCCSNQSLFCKANIDAQVSISLSHKVFTKALAASIAVNVCLPNFHKTNFITGGNSSPPAANNLSVLYQVFRI